MAGLYTATITSSGLRLRECRVVAGLLLRGVDEAEWKREVLDRNALQLGSIESIKRVSRLLRARLEPLGETIWRMVVDGDLELATQAAFAGAVKNSRLLGDFLDIVVREQKALFAEALNPKLWADYIIGCRGRDPAMPVWSDTTVDKLRSAVFSMLAEARYLSDTHSLRLQNVFVRPTLAEALGTQMEAYVLRCLEVME